MYTEPREAVAEPAEAELVDLEAFTSYEDGDAHVICDRENPNAWIRAEETRSLSP